MEEGKLKKNYTHKVYENGNPVIDLVPKDVMELLVFDYSLQLKKKYEKK
jgi:hypothetical protein